MFQSRRTVLHHILAASAFAALPVAGCATRQPRRRYVINGNMPPPPNADEPLDAATKAQLRETGLTAVKFSMGGSNGSYADTIEFIDFLKVIYAANPDVFMQVVTRSDLDTARDTGRIGIIYSFEASTMFEADIAHITQFADLGVRVMQLGYNLTSRFGAGVMSPEPPFGLSEAGHEAVAAMEAGKVLLDLSHAHAQTATDAMNIATRPVAFTHTGCAAIYDHPRNKSDAQIKAVADTGGVTGIYEMSYLTPDLKQQSLDAFMAHIEHALNVCGQDHVGIGSDAFMLGFDTGPENMAQWNALNKMRQDTGIAAPGEGPPPYVEGLNGPHRMPRIAHELALRGHAESVIDKVMGNNFARVFSETWPA